MNFILSPRRDLCHISIYFNSFPRGYMGSGRRAEDVHSPFGRGKLGLSQAWWLCYFVTHVYSSSYFRNFIFKSLGDLLRWVRTHSAFFCFYFKKKLGARRIICRCLLSIYYYLLFHFSFPTPSTVFERAE